jgi:hypothetical protein
MGQITVHSNPHSAFSFSFFPLCVRQGFDEKILHLAVQHKGKPITFNFITGKKLIGSIKQFN